MSRHRYPVEICRVFERTTTTKLQEALTSVKEPDNNEHAEGSEGGNNVADASKGKKGGHRSGKSTESNKAKEGARAKQTTLKVVLGEALGYGPALSEHIILDAGLVPNMKVARDFKLEDNTLQALAEAVDKFEDWLENIISGDKVPEGYILMQLKKLGKDHTSSETGSSNQVTCIIFHIHFLFTIYVFWTRM